MNINVNVLNVKKNMAMWDNTKLSKELKDSKSKESNNAKGTDECWDAVSVPAATSQLEYAYICILIAPFSAVDTVWFTVSSCTLNITLPLSSTSLLSAQNWKWG